MKSNYKRIGDYIREIKVLNKDLAVTDLRGINIDKYFMPSVANTIGTDMSKYKVVKNGQFACNRMHVGRDKRLPISLHKEDKNIIVSPAYTVFEVIEESLLNSEYLMMWFSRKEFDREAWYYTDADVRGGLSLNDLFNIKIPIPSIEIQKKIVKEYRSILSRIELNKNLVKKLDDLAQLIYKQWFEQFNFPSDNKLEYKKNGGKMKFDENLNRNIPLSWNVKSLNDIIEIKHGFAFKGEYITNVENENILLTPGNFKIGGGFKDDNFRYYCGDFSEEYVLKEKDIIVTMTDLSVKCDTIGFPAFIPKTEHKKYLHNQRLGKVIYKIENISYFIYWTMRSLRYREEILSGVTGTTVKHTSPGKILEYKFPFCNDTQVLSKFEYLCDNIQKNIELLNRENKKLRVLQGITLSKISNYK